MFRRIFFLGWALLLSTTAAFAFPPQQTDQDKSSQQNDQDKSEQQKKGKDQDKDKDKDKQSGDDDKFYHGKGINDAEHAYQRAHAGWSVPGFRGASTGMAR